MLLLLEHALIVSMMPLQTREPEPSELQVLLSLMSTTRSITRFHGELLLPTKMVLLQDLAPIRGLLLIGSTTTGMECAISIQL
jgi:hypothetical protein